MRPPFASGRGGVLPADACPDAPAGDALIDPPGDPAIQLQAAAKPDRSAGGKPVRAFETASGIGDSPGTVALGTRCKAIAVRFTGPFSGHRLAIGGCRSARPLNADAAAIDVVAAALVEADTDSARDRRAVALHEKVTTEHAHQ